jgi:two-component system NtrC family sensor kinase
MKLIFKLILLLIFPVCVSAQSELYFKTWSDSQADSLRQVLNNTSNDTLKMFVYRCLGFHYQEKDRDSSFYFHSRQLAMARKLKMKIWQGDALDLTGWVLAYLKNYSLSVEYFLEGIKILEDKECEKDIWMLELFSDVKSPEKARLNCLGFIYNDLSQLYKGSGNRPSEIATLMKGLKIGEESENDALIGLVCANLAQVYFSVGKLDSALNYGQNGLRHINTSGYKTYKGYVLNTIGNVYLKNKDYNTARNYFDSSIAASIAANSLLELPPVYLSLAELYRSEGKIDSAIYFAKKAIAGGDRVGGFEVINQSYHTLYKLYEAKPDRDSAYAYLQLDKMLGDSLNAAEKGKIYAYQDISFSEQMKLREEAYQRNERENRIRTYILIGGIGVIMIIAFLLYRNNLNRKKANLLLQKQNEEIESQKNKVEQALTALKSTQAQLIQSEKMASLGELTAGIAHEIQNPLNFVNNFSEVSEEMIAEAVGTRQEAGENSPIVTELLTDIKQNLAKINHHGKRADAIVKGMLQHSRSTTGNRELTDVNDLVDEYTKLAFHAFKGKDNSFDVKLQTDFDAAVGAIELAPQEIGRVLLNILNNAFYAVNDRKKRDPGFAPQVIVKTTKLTKGIEISVRDNGGGISANIVDKIFQPFFTTKPTGQGTGLGLSLAYDIVKAHGGEIKLDSRQGEGVEFTITLPL